MCRLCFLMLLDSTMKSLIKFVCGEDETQYSSSMKDYLNSLRNLQDEARSWSLTDKEIDCIMEKSIQSFLSKRHPSAHGLYPSAFKLRALTFFCIKLCVKAIFFIVTLSLVVYILLQHKPTQYFIQSKLQDFIYPGMKIVRKLSLPIISTFPSLTDLYDENCLVSNPFFRVSDLPCPCENIRSILNLTGEDTTKEQYHSGMPYIVKLIDREQVTWERLRVLYYKHSMAFDYNANKVAISSLNSEIAWSSPENLFASDWNTNDSSKAYTHVVWRSNRMEPTRILRSLFGIPLGEPSYAAGVTIEKLVIVDGPKALSYPIPTTDGTTVFILQSSGSRLVLLTPASECSHRCSPVSVLLPPAHILWYSLWYWRASSLPSPTSNTLSIAYVGSHR